MVLVNPTLGVRIPTLAPKVTIVTIESEKEKTIVSMESLELKKLVEKFGEQYPDLIAKVQVGEKPLEDSEMEMIDQFVKNEQSQSQSLSPISTQTLLAELKRESYEAPARDPR